MYNLLKIICTLSLKFFFKRIVIVGTENIPKDGPVILAPNHQNTFLDAIIVCSILERHVHSFARGDVFRKKWVHALLRKLHMHPIYRFRDGASNMRKNLEVMDVATDVLKNGKALLIFPEGNHAQQLQLRPIQLGCSRILERYHTDHFAQMATVIPIGLNYSCHQKSAGSVLVNIGKPIEWDLSEEISKRQKLVNFSKSLTEAMKEQIIHIDDENYPQYDENLKKLLSRSKTPFNEFKKLKALIADEHQTLNQVIDQKSSVWINILRFPFATWDSLNHIFPRACIYWLLNNKIKDPEFNAAVIFGLGTFLVPVFHLIQTFVVLTFFGWITALVYLISLPIARWMVVKTSGR